MKRESKLFDDPILGQLPLAADFRNFASDIKLTHSIFALPFIFASLCFMEPIFSARKILMIVACTVCARSFAMGMNRFLDRNIDAKNLRTAARAIPSGRLTPQQGLAWSLGFGALFCLLSALGFGAATGALSPFVLALLGIYPLLKKHSVLVHFYLGSCLGLAPLAASIALQGFASGGVLLLALGMMFWTGGFDIIYSLQDIDFDRANAVKSIPARFGIKKALYISRVSFALAVAFLGAAGLEAGKGALYYVGVGLVGALLALEHWIVRSSAKKLVASKLDFAFFYLNSSVSVVYYLFTQIDVLL